MIVNFGSIFAGMKIKWEKPGTDGGKHAEKLAYHNADILQPVIS